MTTSIFVRTKKREENLLGNLPTCGNPNGKKELAIMHTITEEKYNHMIQYHFGNAIPVVTPKNRIELLAIINNPIGGLLPTHLEFTWNGDSIIINGKTGIPENINNDVDYSVCLFEGIDILDSTPDSYEFVRAIDIHQNPAVVFRTIKNGITGHFYDVSNELP
jgi:hypothetical protein